MGLQLVTLIAQAEEEGGSPLTKIIPGLMIWTLLVFGITLFVLWKFAFGPIQKTIDERRARIRQALDEADHTRTEARRLLEEHRELRARARGEAEEILAEARRVAESMRERVREETDADRQRRLEETRKQVEAETERALERIRAEIADLALVAAERVTRQALGKPEQRKLIDDAIAELDFSALESK
jgi:F-type H+-transporting ATPase subunit b